MHSMIPHAQGFEERHVLVGCCAMQAVRRLRQISAETAVRRTALKREDSLKHTFNLRRVLVAAESHASVCPCCTGGVCRELSVKRTPTSWQETGQSGVSVLLTFFLLCRGSCTCIVFVSVRGAVLRDSASGAPRAFSAAGAHDLCWSIQPKRREVLSAVRRIGISVHLIQRVTIRFHKRSCSQPGQSGKSQKSPRPYRGRSPLFYCC